MISQKTMDDNNLVVGDLLSFKYRIYDDSAPELDFVITGIIEEKEADDFFWHDRLHPDVTGHRLMADMIMNVFDKAYKEDEAADPITNVVEITLFILIPMSLDVSKSLETALMAIPTLVRSMRIVSANTRSRTRNGVMMTTHFVCVPATFTVLHRNFISGYVIGCPPVT